MHKRNKKKIFVTGANGYIASALCPHLARKNQIIGTDISYPKKNNLPFKFEKCDLSDFDESSKIIAKYKPDIIIHCAGIAHRKFRDVSLEDYININSIATEYIAKKGYEANKNMLFIYLSSISIYGEKELPYPVNEEYSGEPSSDYAKSKLDAENRINGLYRLGLLKNAYILRLSPVYDIGWTVNLDKRILCPKKFFYFKIGNGQQKLSALARPNLIDFINYLIENFNLKEKEYKMGVVKINVGDEKEYTFDQIIRIFKASRFAPNRYIIKIPKIIIEIAFKLAGFIFYKRKIWFETSYNKLMSNLVFDNTKMLKIGYKPLYSLSKIFK